jgi:sterol desaturase/sphingolipid hydroxylase (fatty acid hydroxylase superfamily)
VAAFIAASVVLDAGAMFVVPLLFVLVVPFEKMFPRHRGQRIRRPGVGTDVAHALSSPVLATVGGIVALVVGVISLAWVPGLMLRPLVSLIPGAALPIAGIVLFDVAFYWVHRWSHEVPFFWRFHSVHHSPVHMDWISGSETR